MNSRLFHRYLHHPLLHQLMILSLDIKMTKIELNAVYSLVLDIKLFYTLPWRISSHSVCWPLHFLWHCKKWLCNDLSRSCYLYFLRIQTRLKVRVYTVKMKVTSGIVHGVHGIPLESLA